MRNVELNPLNDFLFLQAQEFREFWSSFAPFSQDCPNALKTLKQGKSNLQMAFMLE